MKKVLSGLAALMVCSSVALAAPAVDVKQGEVVAGYNYSSFTFVENVGSSSTDYGKGNMNGFYAQFGIDKKLILGAEYNKGSKAVSNNTLELKYTDVTLQYRLDKNVNLLVGNRKYDSSQISEGVVEASEQNNRLLYGIIGKANLGKNVDGYAGLLKTSLETQWQAGIVYSFSRKSFLDVNYKHHKYTVDNGDITLKGLGFGVGFKF